MKKIALIILFLFFITQLFATHNRAGEITYKCIDPAHFTYEFKIVTYTLTQSPADRPQLTINWGDSDSDTLNRYIIIPITDSIRRNEYIGTHSYSGAGTFKISLEDPNRNGGIVNIPNSVNVVFYIETIVVINPFLGCNNSPELKYPPIDNACIGQIFIHNPVAFDPDGDSLAYELIKCKEQNGNTIPGYSYPQTNSSFTLNPVTGDLIWDSPLFQGEYNVAFLIKEYRKGVFIGSVERDMQITVVTCNNHPPYFDDIKDTCVVAGTNLTFNVTAHDNDVPINNITLTAYGGPFIVNNHAHFLPPYIGSGSVSSTFSWSTNCENVKKNPYSATFRAVDNGSPVNLVALKTVNIRIVAPAPTNLTASPIGNTIKLQWDSYVCSNAKGFKIFRKDNGASGWIHGYCETGIPSGIGYVRIATVNNINDTTFIDNNGGSGLIHGNDYCYMLYAYFTDGAESYASNETCVQLKKDVPVITNVDIKTTDAANGKIYVAWSKPAGMDTIVNPGPYKYLIYRSSDFYGNNLTLIDSNYKGINDTLYNDTIIPLDTKNYPHSYRIVLKNNFGIIGETHIASSVFLSIAPFDNRLLLTWEEHVPWTNNSYEIYRYNPVTTNFDFIATASNKNYTDTGLTNGRTYCYKIKSIGEYSGAGFIKPIINFSQEVCETPVDNELPCPPVLSIIPNCDNVENFLIWTNPNHFCSNDVVKYYIYYSPEDNGSFELIKTITNLSDTIFLHNNLKSIAGCYFITAIDSFNNESATTNKICLDIDSCSLYKLPNVFTPNDDGFNDYYRPFPYKFVQKIDLKIYNRWGNVVFQTSNPDIMWDGKDQHTKLKCSDGVYYYVCAVYEQRLAGLKKRTLHGFVQIIR
ncbi:MAG: gliding motility-associated C-terminal domain-containing protein [Bacteroidales bacterium]|jgi:gliding motility-associated-like protein